MNTILASFFVGRKRACPQLRNKQKIRPDIADQRKSSDSYLEVIYYALPSYLLCDHNNGKFTKTNLQKSSDSSTIQSIPLIDSDNLKKNDRIHTIILISFFAFCPLLTRRPKFMVKVSHMFSKEHSQNYVCFPGQQKKTQNTISSASLVDTSAQFLVSCLISVKKHVFP